MAAVIFFSLGLFVFITLPILTYFYARHLNRNPKIWFLIGLILPGIATLNSVIASGNKESRKP